MIFFYMYLIRKPHCLITDPITGSYYKNATLLRKGADNLHAIDLSIMNKKYS